MKEPVLFKNANEWFVPGASYSYQENLRVAQGCSLDKTVEWNRVVGNGPQVASVELVAEANSQLEYVFFQNFAISGEGQSLDSIGRIQVTAHAHSKVKLTVVQNGSNRSQIEVSTRCEGEGAEIEIRGLQQSKDEQKLAIQVNAVHPVPHTKSDLSVWCVAKDRSQSVFNGLITIEAGAHHTEAYQKNKNLILSEKATIDSFPKLLIANDEVKCAHGSSTSTIDPEQFLYLQCRGIDAQTAEKMLVNGVIHRAIDWLKHDQDRNLIAQAMGAKSIEDGEEFT